MGDERKEKKKKERCIFRFMDPITVSCSLFAFVLFLFTFEWCSCTYVTVRGKNVIVCACMASHFTRAHFIDIIPSFCTRHHDNESKATGMYRNSNRKQICLNTIIIIIYFYFSYPPSPP